MAHDEAGTSAVMNAHRDAIAGMIRKHGGRVVDAVGDNLLAEFGSVVDAVACAAEIQRDLAERNSALRPERRLSFRIGIHLGDLLVDDERLVGDGINIAARVQQLSDAGGICLSRAAFDQVEGKLSLDFEDLGDRSLKNIPKPVRAYKVILGSREDAKAPAAGALQGISDLTIPGFSGRPAIAVLAFDNLSGDPEQEYFADGITEDLITRLAALTLPVIARNSSFAYKGTPVNLKQVGRELGVRYVVEGSVRKAGRRVRISAQLIDANTGHHVWAEQYDRDLRDIFALQDEITEAIVGTMAPELLKFEAERAARGPVENLDAWEHALKAYWYFSRITRDDNAKARSLCEQATTLDPNLAVAFACLAAVHFYDVFHGWTESPSESISRLTEAARKCVELDDREPMAHLVMSFVHRLAGRPDQELAAMERTLQLNPSFALAYFQLGLHLAMANRPEEAIATLEKGWRLSPKDPWAWVFFFGMALAHIGAGRYEEAVRYAKRSLELRNHPSTHRTLAVSNAHLGRIEEARSALEEAMRQQPDFSVAGLRLTSQTAALSWVEIFVDGLRKAGLKE
jgi:adenylate cyclase